MRQLGTLPNRSDAERLAAWLVTQRIDAHAEQSGDAWAIWVRDEDHLAESREALAHFQANPQDQRYRGAETQAERVRREEEQERKRALGNVVEMRNRWGSGLGGAARRCPLVLALIGASVIVALFTNAGRTEGPILDALRILSLQNIDLASGTLDVWACIRQGQVWRLITPIFIHYGIWHLVFNMFWLFDLGGQIENRRGTWYMLLLVLGLAVLANIGQGLEASAFGGRGFAFGGMSGVGYGIFGYLLIKVRFDNRDHYQLSPVTVVIGLVWFVLCLARSFPDTAGLLSFIPPIANSAHTVGLFAGMAIAYAPLLFPRRDVS
ncbi:MAG: rhomboid family intramembrane serine protease [Planctomycetaceae bacterium]|nr:rhomboid family intramembrane serine protease [Planctomycetaceae bacterium]